MGNWIAGIVATVLAGVILAVVTPMVLSRLGPSGTDQNPVIAAPAHASMGPLETGTNRQGDDYDAYGKPAANPELCAEMCRTDGQCKAMTYVSQTKLCWLKTAVPQASATPGMTSSVKANP
jgi:hypothetical protein